MALQVHGDGDSPPGRGVGVGLTPMKVFAEPRKSHAGGRECDRVLAAKRLVLQPWYHLSDDRTESQMRDRDALGRFLGLNPKDVTPDAKVFRNNTHL